MEVGPMGRPQVILGARRSLQGLGKSLPWNCQAPAFAPEFMSLHPVLPSASSRCPSPRARSGQGLAEGLWHPLQAASGLSWDMALPPSTLLLVKA